MPENVNWFAVFQSIVDTWWPFILILAVIIGYFIFRTIKSNNN